MAMSPGGINDLAATLLIGLARAVGEPPDIRVKRIYDAA
jgi:hypothetical protein